MKDEGGSQRGRFSTTCADFFLVGGSGPCSWAVYRAGVKEINFASRTKIQAFALVNSFSDDLDGYKDGHSVRYSALFAKLWYHSGKRKFVLCTSKTSAWYTFTTKQ